MLPKQCASCLVTQLAGLLVPRSTSTVAGWLMVTGSRRSLAGKVAVVTGAGRGLGRAYADALGARGARVCVAEVDPQTGERTAVALPDGRFCQTDVGDPDQ